MNYEQTKNLKQIGDVLDNADATITKLKYRSSGTYLADFFLNNEKFLLSLSEKIGNRFKVNLFQEGKKEPVKEYTFCTTVTDIKLSLYNKIINFIEREYTDDIEFVIAEDGGDNKKHLVVMQANKLKNIEKAKKQFGKKLREIQKEGWYDKFQR